MHRGNFKDASEKPSFEAREMLDWIKRANIQDLLHCLPHLKEERHGLLYGLGPLLTTRPLMAILLQV